MGDINLKPGDRIACWCHPSGAYVEYCQIFPEELAIIKVPENVSSEEASFLELAIGT